MAKILLVEDDNNLREIYEARLMAEGYDIVSARDGEEALSVAIKEKPDLVISDVMMPKISGFDMLDILRTTEETKNVKVIMMTALSQAEDKARAEKLGADRYLVKSQVTLEDVAKVAKEVLEGGATSAPSTDTPAPAPAAPVTPVADTTTPTPTTVIDTPAPVAQPVTTPEPTTQNEPAEEPPHPAESTIDAEEQAIAQQLESIIAQSVPAASQPAPDSSVQSNDAAPAEASTTPEASTDPEQAKPARKVIEPINDLKQDMKPKLEALVAAEEQKEAAALATPQQTEPAPTAAPQETTLPQPTTSGNEEKVDPNLIAL